MKYLYFDTSLGFTPLMALGALIDMCREENFVNEFLHPFKASLFTENVKRGCFEGCLAHIDIPTFAKKSPADVISELFTDENQKRTAEKYIKLKVPGAQDTASELRELFEALCVYELVQSLGITGVYYDSKSIFAPADAFVFESEPVGLESDLIGTADDKISVGGYALLSLLGASTGSVPAGEITATGYGAGSPVQNPDGIVSVMLYEGNFGELFVTDKAIASIFAEEVAIF